MGLFNSRETCCQHKQPQFRSVLFGDTIRSEICHKKNCNTMKIFVHITVTILTSLFFCGCTKDYSNIDEHIWKLTKIETANGFSSKTPNIDQPEREDRYMLRFNKDLATAQMFLIVNSWSAHYQVVQNGSITLSGSTTTEVGYNGNEIWVEDTINAYGSDTFNYAIAGKKLTLQSSKITMTFLCIE